MFNKILVVYNEKLSEKHLQVVSKVKEILKETNFSTLKHDRLEEEDFRGVDLVITLGGDGTFTKAANFLKETPILGINSEPETSEGALASIKEDEIECLREVLKGNFETIKRQRAKIKLDGKEIHKLALNEVYVGTNLQFHASRYIIEHKGKREEQRSSGVIVSTGSGSKAWYLSAGGIPFNYGEPVLKFLVREPYLGERVYKPKVLSGEIKEEEKLVFESTRDYGGIIAMDNLIYNFNKGSKVEIGISEFPLKVIIKNI